MPARSDIDPLKVPQLLPNIGLIELKGCVDDAAFRLAGTRLHDIYGQEITGKRLDDVFSGEQASYWRRIHASVAGMGAPLNGVVRGPAKGRDHIVLFWLRLPLSDDGGLVDRILCYDIAGPTESGRAQAERALICYSGVHPRPSSSSRRVRFG